MDRGVPPAIGRAALVASITLGVAVGALVAVRDVAAGIVAGLVAAAAVALVWTRRDRRRRRIARAPFPEAWREVLEQQVAFYRALDEGERRRFEREAAFFLDETTITGPRGAPITDELRVLVAASAVALIFGRPGFRYPRLRDVVVYEDSFDEGYEVGPRKGILGAVHAQGPILLSARSLRQGFRGERDGHNVGYHELAHVLDFDAGAADGVPSFVPWAAVGPWLEVMRAEMSKVRRGRSVLRRYAATHEAEMFAVATEAFFERPVRLREQHPELYAMLAEAYGQDPAARASVRAR